MTTREQAIQWWNGLKLTERVVYMNKNNVEPYRNSECLIGREIEEIWRKEIKTENIYLNRLKEQYKDFYSTKYSKQKEREYEAVCLFCLNTNLVSSEEIQLMQSEVISSF